MVRLTVGGLYPRATEKRLWRTETAFKKDRNGFFKASGKNFLLLQLLFLGLFSYIFGSLFQQDSHIHNFNIAFVDYDGGQIGHAVRDAYTGLAGKGFPTLVEQSAADFATIQDLETAICRIQFWGALYVQPGASDRLQRALSGDLDLASYDPKDVMGYIWNEARYPAVVDSSISGNLNTLSQAARVAYTTANGTGIARSLTTPDTISVFANPWILSDINLQPTAQGSRLIYNTLVIILILIQEFFYLGIINGLYLQFKIYNRMNPWRIIIIRGLNAVTYCMVGSLCTTGAIWAFRAGWNVNGNQFVLTWMTLWLFAHVNFQVLDITTIWLPLPYIPMCLITWVILNVTSVLLPFELSAGFYKLGYAIPAHEAYNTLLDIWSRGCNPKLRYSLPILFAWEVFGLIVTAVGIFRRCHYATVAEEQQAKQFQERVDAAMGIHKRQEEEERAERKEEEEERAESTDLEAGPDTIEKIRTGATGARQRTSSRVGVENEIASVIAKTDARIRREQSKTNTAMDYGPAFSLPFGNHRGNDSDDS